MDRSPLVLAKMLVRTQSSLIPTLLVDESFSVVVVEDCCAAATMDLHHHELEIINMIYCHVVQLDECLDFFTA